MYKGFKRDCQGKGSCRWIRRTSALQAVGAAGGSVGGVHYSQLGLRACLNLSSLKRRAG